MKMHSYMSVNGYLQHVTEQSQQLLDTLRKATRRVGGWDQAIIDASARRAEFDASTNGSSSAGPSPVATPPIPNGTQGSYMDADDASVLRKRLLAASVESQRDTKFVSDNKKAVPSPAEPHPLVDHPDEEISDLAKEYSELQGELRSPGPEYVVWPNNISLKNFAVYQLIPTLVYELEYPRTDRWVRQHD